MEVLQRDMARAKANRVRMVQAAFRRNIKAGDRETAVLLACEVIADPPEDLAGMKVDFLLRALPGIGEEKSAAILRKTRISSTRKLRDFTDHERERLIARIQNHRSGCYH